MRKKLLLNWSRFSYGLWEGVGADLIAELHAPWWINGKLNGFMKDIHGSKKPPKRLQCRQYSLLLIYFFLLREQLQGSVSVRSIEGFTNFKMAPLRVGPLGDLWSSLGVRNRVWIWTHEQWRGRQRRWKNFRKERKGGNDYFNLVFTYVIFNMREVAISPKYNFEKYWGK